MKLTYSYTRKLSSSNREWYIKFYKASILRAKKLGYYIKLYGCNYAENFLSDYVDEFINIEDQTFILTDDLKIWIHTQEDLDCITVDGDLILDDKLDIRESYDVLFDFCVNIKKHNIQFRDNLNLLKEYNLDSKIRYFNYDGNFSTNVGLLKFNNQETKTLLLEHYYNFREYVLSNSSQFSNLLDSSTIVCEYYFARILESENKKYGFLKNWNNYTHYLGYKKHTKQFADVVNSILETSKTILI